MQAQSDHLHIFQCLRTINNHIYSESTSSERLTSQKVQYGRDLIQQEFLQLLFTSDAQVFSGTDQLFWGHLEQN